MNTEEFEKELYFLKKLYMDTYGVKVKFKIAITYNLWIIGKSDLPLDIYSNIFVYKNGRYGMRRPESFLSSFDKEGLSPYLKMPENFKNVE